MGKYVVTDTNNHRIVSIDPKEYLTEELFVASKERKKEHWNLAKPMLPHSIIALSDSECHYLVTDTNNDCIHQIKNGDSQIWFPGYKTSDKTGRLTGIASNGGRVFVSDCERKKIYVLDASGDLLRTISCESSSPMYLAINSKGWLFVTCGRAGIMILNEENNKLETIKIALSRTYSGITFDKNDNAFVAGYNVCSFGCLSRNKLTVLDCQLDHVTDASENFCFFGHYCGLCLHDNIIVVCDGNKNRLVFYNILKPESKEV